MELEKFRELLLVWGTRTQWGQRPPTPIFPLINANVSIEFRDFFECQGSASMTIDARCVAEQWLKRSTCTCYLLMKFPSEGMQFDLQEKSKAPSGEVPTCCRANPFLSCLPFKHTCFCESCLAFTIQGHFAEVRSPKLLVFACAKIIFSVLCSKSCGQQFRWLCNKMNVKISGLTHCTTTVAVASCLGFYEQGKKNLSIP